jgi:F0F1-type ATP synthase assembly protein I
MQQTTAPSKTPSPESGTTKKTDRSTSAVFMSMALDMSWRLAIVVLVPIIGGFELDKHLHTTPLLTIVGFILAMAGMAFVMWQTLQAANRLSLPASAAGHSKRRQA